MEQSVEATIVVDDEIVRVRVHVAKCNAAALFRFLGPVTGHDSHRSIRQLPLSISLDLAAAAPAAAERG